MLRRERIQFIKQVASQAYQLAFSELESQVQSSTIQEIGEELLECGIIPEEFSHDSSEEKLWAKYCDILCSRVFSFLNIETTVIRRRSDSADIRGETAQYSIVGDAKAFRLSRSAKNQKDFKVAALSKWRKTDTYACLVAPLYQYPSKESQIYEQASTQNVTLLSYVHLRFLLDYPPQVSLEALWQLVSNLTPSKSSQIYWHHIDEIVVNLTNQSHELLKDYKKLEIAHAAEIGQESINYWQSVIESYQTFSKEEAIKQLIKAEKLDQKIRVIASAIAKASKAHE